MILLDAAACERFLKDWYAVTGPEGAERALIALSGGPDSSALLLLMAGNGPIAAATVDHGLRPESAAEAKAAAALAQSCGIEHSILNGPLPERAGPTANLSARARDLRYGLLEAHATAIGARWIVTAHHADDQLETMIMRLNRGAGVRGLAAVRSRNERIVRPLLGWRRRELAAIVASCGVTPVDDPTNIDDRFDRARLRKALATAHWIDPVMVAQSASALAEADAAIAWSADRAATERCTFTEQRAILLPAELPREIQRRLVERCLRHIDPAIDLRGRGVTGLIDSLQNGSSVTLGKVAARVSHKAKPTESWVFRKAPPRRSL